MANCSASGPSYDQRGPFRQSICDVNATSTDSLTYWNPRDTLAWWYDGTSNQICIGEKNFSLEDRNQVGNYKRNNHDDTTYFTCHEDGQGVSGLLRTVDSNWKIERAGYYESSDHGSSVFGANHTGVCNFLIGDGSVRGISHTTSRDILVPLSIVDDGVSVALP